MMLNRFKTIQVEITDEDFLASIPLLGVQYYLEENEWALEEAPLPGNVMSYKKDNQLVFIPEQKNQDRYAQILMTALRIISKVDGVNQFSIVEAMLEYEENWNRNVHFLQSVHTAVETEEPSDEIIENEERLFDNLKKEYVKELKAAVEEAKTYNERRFNHSGMPKSPLYEHGRVIAVFRKYWLKCDELNRDTSLYYNPKWLTHEDLSGELRQIIDDMPFYPIGTEKSGNYC